LTGLSIEGSPLDEYLSVREIPEWHGAQVGRYHPSVLVYCLYRQWLDFKEPVTGKVGYRDRAAWLGSLIHRGIAAEGL